MAQELTNKGRDFWLCYPGHIDGNNSRMALYISATVNARGTVTYPGGSVNFAVAANEATTVQIEAINTINAQNEGISPVPKGIHVISDVPIVLYAHVLNASRSGSSLILPTTTLGKEYMVSSYKSSANSFTYLPNNSPAGSQFQVLAVEEGITYIEITPTTTDVGGTRAPNTPYIIQLRKGEVYQYRTVFTEDVTGSRIKSVSLNGEPCKRIAVFSGSSWTGMDCAGTSSGDNLFQQMLPIKNWGLQYITAPMADVEYNIYRILVSDPTTQVMRNGSILPAGDLVRNAYYEFKSSTPNIITANKAVLVLQYMVSQNCDSRNNSSGYSYPADPEMIILSPVEQTINDVTVVSARADLTPPLTAITKHFLSIIIKDDGIPGLRIDGAPPVGSFIAIGTSGYSYLNENVTASTEKNVSHRITADTGFIALAYGLGNQESYGYNAGTSVKDLYKFLSVKNLDTRINFPATCRYTDFNLSIVLPYQPDSISWKFNGLFADMLVKNPAYDSTWMVNAQRVYRYSLPAGYNITSPAGAYLINLEVFIPSTDGCGGMEEVAYHLEVYDRPISNFTPGTIICLGDSISFRNTTVIPPPRKSVYNFWDMGDGFSYTDKDSLKHKFSLPGSYNISHHLITDIGCVSDTVVKTVNINPPPVAAFNITPPYCIGAALTFTDQSVTTGGETISKYIWDYGDGNKQTLTTNTGHTHVYTTTGSYVASLQVESSNKCLSNIYTQSLTIGQKPDADFSIPDICSNDNAVFNGQDISTTGTPVAGWAWNFGDGNTATGRNVTHRFAAGSYNVRLIAQSAAGCTDTATHNIVVNGGNLTPNFTINPTGTLCGGPITFMDASAIDYGKISRLTIQWNAANPTAVTTDNTPASGKTYTHNYPAFSTPASLNYTVNYIIYSGQSCADTLTRNISIMATPALQFNTMPEYCSNAAPFAITQAVVSNNMPGTGAFTGRGITAAGNFSPVNAGAGTHAITYTYTATNGCSTSVSKNIIVHPAPVANAGRDKAVLVGTAGINLAPALITGIPVTYTWSPATFLDNPNIANPKIENITRDIVYILTVTSNKGCVDTDDVAVKLVTEVKLPNIFSPNGDGINDTWNIEFLESYPNSVLSIFNRYGQEIKRFTNYKTPWDGTINGKPVSNGTYYYVIDLKNGSAVIKGFVDIIR